MAALGEKLGRSDGRVVRATLGVRVRVGDLVGVCGCCVDVAVSGLCDGKRDSGCTLGPEGAVDGVLKDTRGFADNPGWRDGVNVGCRDGPLGRTVGCSDETTGAFVGATDVAPVLSPQFTRCLTTTPNGPEPTIAESVIPLSR